MALEGYRHLKASFLSSLSPELSWTSKLSLQVPTLWQFVVGIIRRRRGGFNYDERRRLVRKLSSPDFVVITLLSIAYFFSVFARVSVSILAPELQVDPELDYDSHKHGQVIIVAQICHLFGRLINGFLIDMANPRFMMIGYMVGSAVITFLFSAVHTIVPNKDNRFGFILACTAINACFQSGMWLAATRFIYDHFRPAQYGKAIVVLSVLSKLGSVGAMLSLAGLISAPLYWQDAQMCASGLTLFGVVFILGTFNYPHPSEHLAAESAEEHHKKKFAFDAPAPSKEEVATNRCRCTPQDRAQRMAFARSASIRWLGWWTKKQFILVAIANAAMGVVLSIEGLEAFLPLYFFNALGTDSKVASLVAIVLPLGVTISLLFGGAVLEQLDKPSRADAVLFMLIVTVAACIALLGVTAGVEAAYRANPSENTTGYLAGAIITILVIGSSMGYAYFVPISTFALTFGGEHAALASATLNVFASVIGAAFSAAVGSLAASSWTAVMGIVLAFAIVALCSMLLFYYFELVDKRKALARAKAIFANLNILAVRRSFSHAHKESNPESNFFRPDIPVDQDKHSLAVIPTPDGDGDVRGSAQVAAEGEEVRNFQQLTVKEKWALLRRLYGPSLRHDGNKKVRRRVSLILTTCFVIFGFAIFVSYFEARSNPNFVFPFGDVTFANRTRTP